MNNIYGNVEFYFDNNYNQSSRRLNNRVLFRELSEKSQQQQQQQQKHPLGVVFTTTQESDEPVIDFLKDKKEEMTNGRKMALWLMKFKWYYPYGGGDSVGDKDDTRPSEFFESENAIGKSGDFGNGDGDYIPKNLKTKMDNGYIGDSNEKFEEVKLQGAIVPPSLEKAWAYFEHITLPRFVYEDEKDGAKLGIRGHNGNHQRLEIAESGEKHFSTKLYNPFFTPLSELGDFGLGIALYFTTLRALMLLLLLAGLVSIPNILYFSSSEYSNGQQNVHWALKGSSACTNYEFVPCTDCTEDNFKRTMERLRIVSNESGEKLFFALKNNCDGVSQTTVLTNLAATVVVIVGFAIISLFLSKQEIKFDEDVQTAQDYSIVIRNPPSDAIYPQEWRDFFSINFEGAHVTCCTVSVHNKELVKALAKRREILEKIRKSIPPGESLEHDVLAVLATDVKEARCFSIFNGLPEYHAELLKLEAKIKDMLISEYPVSSVFITFETETTQRRVLRALTQDEGKSPGKRKYFFRENFEPLRVFEAPEPSAVRWQDLSYSTCSIIVSLIIPSLFTVLLLVGSTFFNKYLRDAYPDEPSYAAFAISAGNLLFPNINRALTNLEIHREEGQRQSSLYFKNAAFRWINTAIVMTLLEVRRFIKTKFNL